MNIFSKKTSKTPHLLNLMGYVFVSDLSIQYSLNHQLWLHVQQRLKGYKHVSHHTKTSGSY